MVIVFGQTVLSMEKLSLSFRKFGDFAEGEMQKIGCSATAELCALRKRTSGSRGKKWLASLKKRGRFLPQNRNIRVGCPSTKKFGLILKESMDQ
ncbi:hypothetical protein COY05_01525 [Candidatus Peregrinibacteria bacterium CG_4_10_14_0_2_um_filter_38_24]|nr:MAG: hypothetical protein COY05_01525 [Candidatus Peregrinibacteria bacterium CG_4_10_14_0_2_um_filter_38_24]